MSEEGRGLPGWVLPSGLVLAIGLLVAVALMRGPADFDPDSPEGVVQEYLQALNERRWDDALAVIHEDSLGDCQPDDLTMFVDPNFTAELGHDTGGGFDGGFVEERFAPDVEEGFLPENADETVDVTIIHGNTGGIIDSGWSEFVQFQLAEEDGFWWIINDPWPYFTWNCRF